MSKENRPRRAKSLRLAPSPSSSSIQQGQETRARSSGPEASRAQVHDESEPPQFSALLQPLQIAIDVILVTFKTDKDTQKSDWYQRLSIQSASIKKSGSLTRSQLLNNSILTDPYDTADLSAFDSLPDTQRLLESRLQIVESCRQDVIDELRTLPTPSKFANTYGKIQENPDLAL